ncbi:MAG: ABC transporter ATP-binding protein [Candidatus Coproplasma sp.]
MNNGLEIKNLTVDLGGFKLDNINLEIKQGAITGLIGKNGAGKTTLIKTIMRQYNALSGKILYNGKSFAENEVEILSKIACVFDSPHFNSYAKPKKLVKIYQSFYPSFDVQKYNQLMEKFNLPSDRKITKYSLGMQRKYCLILALCQGADILILDEPTSGIDPYDRGEVVSLIQEFMLDESKTVLFSTHITEDLDKIADYIVMMDGGKITLNEDKETLAESYRLVQTDELTEEMQKCAIGVKKSMFGYTFITTDKSISGENIKSKIPTLEELFIHLTYDKTNPYNALSEDNADSKDIFGI